MLYLVRHGEAVVGADDFARALTKDGRKEVTLSSKVAFEMGVEVDRIVQSGRLRALQTAEIWADALKPTPTIEEYADIQPMTHPSAALELIESAGSLMIVGHLPHLSRLASLLVVGDPEEELVAFPTGGVVALSEVEGQWRIRWFLTPKLAKAVANSRK